MRGLTLFTLGALLLACESTDEGELGAGSTGGSTSGGSSADSGGTSMSGGSTSSGGSSPSGGGGACTPDYSCQPEVLPSSGDPAQDCVDRINQFRACTCLPALARWTEAESCADEQAEYDVENGAHAGWSGGVSCEPKGWAQNECPGWGSTEDVIDGCIQMMFDEGPPSEDPCEGQCYQEHGHFLNMTKPSYTKVGCGFFVAEDGKVWSVHNFE